MQYCMHLYHSILIMIQSYVYTDVMFFYSHNLPIAVCCSISI